MQRPHTSKIDMWALGIILYKLVSSGAHPFESTNYHEMIKSITDKEPNPLPPTASPFIKRLIAMLLQKNP
jgi:serine/threonine protein kinase